MGQRIVIAGASGLIGTALRRALEERGDAVLSLVRREPDNAGDRSWDPASGSMDSAVLDGVDAVVCLSGAGVGDSRWTPAYKRHLLQSRVDSTGTLARAIAASGRPIRLVAGSAVGAYGDRGDEALDEDSSPGEGFLAELVRAWEAAAGPARDSGAPVAHARTGIVLSRTGGAMGRVLPLARLGLAGPLGSGRQFWPWITLVDEVRALMHLIDRPDLVGPVNLVGPTPSRQRDLMQAIGTALHRPAVLPAPAPALRLALGEFASDILGSQRVVGRVLVDSGFAHTHAHLGSAVSWLVGHQD